eukprot:5775836-Pyramimonas_sp.AAC.1
MDVRGDQVVLWRADKERIDGRRGVVLPAEIRWDLRADLLHSVEEGSPESFCGDALSDVEVTYREERAL